MASFSAIINASLEKVWNHLIYKIEHPEAFVPGVSNVIILEKTNKYVLREMTISLEDIPIQIIEKITSEPNCVRFEIVEHPKFKGCVDNEATAISDNETQITYTMNWVDKVTETPFENSEIIKNAVLKTKHYIEQNS